MLSRKLAPAVDASEGVFAGAVGLWLALSLIKFGNPVIFDQQIHAPGNLDELLISPWPITWGYALLALVFLGGSKFCEWRTPAPMWLTVVPLGWLGWQFVSATQTVDRGLTLATLQHFVACVGAFYIGMLALARVTRLGPFWLGLAGGFVVVLIAGWKQHFGGLEEMRRYFYGLPDWQNYPPEFLKKVSSNRIYSTLFYPNALAGVILLLMPASLSIVWDASRALPSPLKLLLTGTIGVLGLGSLYWSGSKSAWLIAMVQGSFVLLRSPLRMRCKVIFLVAALSLGLGLFWLNHQAYFGRGATSVAARFDYWRAACKTLATNPILGSGPGTFMVSYKKLKPPEAEMARLAHNDFLQQGSDSGWPGLLAYAAWIFGGIAMLYPKCGTGLTSLSVWLGLTGMALQSFVEFGLYIPALAWPFFLLLGWRLGAEGIEESNRQRDSDCLI
jgi:hypothetical protein